MDQNQKKSSIAADGSRDKIRVADVQGRFTNYRNLVFVILMGVFTLVPWIKVGGHPLLFIDILHRQFYIAGLTFNAQDFYLVFFFAAGAFFCLFYITMVLGRVWCGWTCPQTVWLEGLFRKIERFIEGPRAQQIKLAKGPWTFEKTVKFIIKHILFLFLANLVAHIVLSYFVSMDNLLHFVTSHPQNHPTAFGFMLFITGILYLDFAWFREQVCLILCPYGRMQSTLTDDDTLVIGYDELRGEPRGKKNDASRGACIDCHRCVDVCPTGIDIRNGLQLECIGCANCVDACDDIMIKIGQKTGLVRYDSYNGFNNKPKKILRPRFYLYTFILLLGGLLALVVFTSRQNFEANILRAQGSPYVLLDQKIRNQFNLHIFNKSEQEVTFSIEPQDYSGVTYILPLKQVRLGSLTDKMVPLFVEMLQSDFKGQFTIQIKVTNQRTGKSSFEEVQFLGP